MMAMTTSNSMRVNPVFSLVRKDEAIKYILFCGADISSRPTGSDQLVPAIRVDYVFYYFVPVFLEKSKKLWRGRFTFGNGFYFSYEYTELLRQYTQLLPQQMCAIVETDSQETSSSDQHTM